MSQTRVWCALPALNRDLLWVNKTGIARIFQSSVSVIYFNSLSFAVSHSPLSSLSLHFSSFFSSICDSIYFPSKWMCMQITFNHLFKGMEFRIRFYSCDLIRESTFVRDIKKCSNVPMTAATPHHFFSVFHPSSRALTLTLFSFSFCFRSFSWTIFGRVFLPCS